MEKGIQHCLKTFVFDDSGIVGILNARGLTFYNICNRMLYDVIPQDSYLNDKNKEIRFWTV